MRRVLQGRNRAKHGPVAKRSAESSCALASNCHIVHSRFMSPPRLEQVAAVCYRVGESGIEFLLIRSRKGRWTFPKGSVEPGWTGGQAAALEAFEEAGVHGCVEELPFARYFKRGRSRFGKSELTVHAHLCEVLLLATPQEPDRNPTWFPAEQAKRRLEEQRRPEKAAKLASVVDRAVVRINRLRSGSHSAAAPLEKAQFKAASS
jgi:8-oxo-dGTP pyrophosphatase MutT (NUDIX family)